MNMGRINQKCTFLLVNVSTKIFISTKITMTLGLQAYEVYRISRNMQAFCCQLRFLTRLLKNRPAVPHFSSMVLSCFSYYILFFTELILKRVGPCHKYKLSDQVLSKVKISFRTAIKNIKKREINIITLSLLLQKIHSVFKTFMNKSKLMQCNPDCLR